MKKSMDGHGGANRVDGAFKQAGAVPFEWEVQPGVSKYKHEEIAVTKAATKLAPPPGLALHGEASPGTFDGHAPPGCLWPRKAGERRRWRMWAWPRSPTSAESSPSTTSSDTAEEVEAAGGWHF